MKTMHFRKKIAGIGLIEALITAVVIAVGLLAVAALQGNLIGDSRENKTRAEAQTLANAKIEQLRDTLERTAATGVTNAAGYNDLASSTTPDSIGGITETFTRSWTVTNQTNPDRKQISVMVCWSDGCNSTNPNKENQVTAQSVITFDAAGNSVLSSEDAALSGSTPVYGPSTNAESSDEITEIKNVPDGNPGTVYTDANGQTWIRQNSRTRAIRAAACTGLNAFENDLMTRRIDHDGVTGNEAIELYEKVTISSTDYCIPRIRYNGGVIIPIRGIVHSGATTGNGNNQSYLDVDLFTFNASETGAYCVFKPESGAISAPYVCYVGGNCTGFTGTTDDSDVTKCPSGSYAAAKVGPGGWRGKVGLLGVAGPSNNYRNVCFAEEIASSPATLDTARNYYARRNNLNEGINKPYNCHDFLIIQGQSTNARVHDECVTQANAIGGFRLASKTIQRDIASGNNIFDPTIDTSFCVGSTGTSYTITGSISGASSTPTVTITDGSNNGTCSSITSSSYTCTITTSATSVTISGIYNNQPKSCILSPVSTSGCTLAFTTVPTYTITGHIRANTQAAANSVSLEAIDGTNTIPCTNNNDYNNSYNTYTCVVATASTSVSLSAVASLGYRVTPASYTVSSLSGSTSTVVVSSPENDFVASAIPTHTISGRITIGSNVSKALSITDKLISGNCGTAANGDGVVPPPQGWIYANGNNAVNYGTYQCTFYESTTNSFSLAVDPYTYKSGNDYINFTITATPSPSGSSITGTNGQLQIDLSNVQTNKVYNININ